MSVNNDEAVVVGAGVSGLTTALCLTELGWRVRVVAAEAPEATTSMVPGALWGPCFAEPVAKTAAWTEASLRDFRLLVDDPASGVRMAPTLSVGGPPADGPLPPQVKLIPELRPARPEELPDGYASGFRAMMPVIDMPRYLPYLTARLAAGGTVVERRRVPSLAEAAGGASVVVDCAGLGARELAGDDTLVPDFGQHVILENPGIDRVFIDLSGGREGTSFVPHPDRVVCGSVNITGRWDAAPDPDVTDGILRRCRAVEPRLRDAKVLDVLTGLRPSRPAVRVEAETIDGVRVVHNYGHSGHGVSLSWGTAREAATLATPTT